MAAIKAAAAEAKRTDPASWFTQRFISAIDAQCRRVGRSRYDVEQVIRAVSEAMSESTRKRPQVALRPAAMSIDSGAKAVELPDPSASFATADPAAAAALAAAAASAAAGLVKQPPSVAILSSRPSAPSEHIASLYSLAAGTTSALQLSRGVSPAASGAMADQWGIEAMWQLARAQMVERGELDPTAAHGDGEADIAAADGTEADEDALLPGAPRREHPAMAAIRHEIQPLTEVVPPAMQAELPPSMLPDAVAELCNSQALAEAWRHAAWHPALEAPWPASKVFADAAEASLQAAQRVAAATATGSSAAARGGHARLADITEALIPDAAALATAAAGAGSAPGGVAKSKATEVGGATAQERAVLEDPFFIRIDASALPLEAFDDDGFERRTSTEWLRYGPLVDITLEPSEMISLTDPEEAATLHFTPELDAIVQGGDSSMALAPPPPAGAGAGSGADAGAGSEYSAASSAAARRPRSQEEVEGKSEDESESRSAASLDAAVTFKAPLAFSPMWCTHASEFRYSACAVLASHRASDSDVDMYHIKLLRMSSLPAGVQGAATPLEEDSASAQAASVPSAELLAAAAMRAGIRGVDSLLGVDTSLDPPPLFRSPQGPLYGPLVVLADSSSLASSTKCVPRLSLRFASERPRAHEMRRASAAATREDTKARIRYKTFLAALPHDADVVEQLPTAWQRRILRRAVREADTEPVLRRFAATVKSVLDEARLDFTLALRRAAYEYCLRHPVPRIRHVALRLPVPLPLQVSPAMGMCTVSQSGLRTSFHGALSLLQESFRLTVQPMWLSLYWLSAYYNVKLRHRRFVDLRLSEDFAFAESDADKRFVRDKHRRRMRMQLTGNTGLAAVPAGLLRRAAALGLIPKPAASDRATGRRDSSDAGGKASARASVIPRSAVLRTLSLQVQEEWTGQGSGGFTSKDGLVVLLRASMITFAAKDSQRRAALASRPVAAQSAALPHATAPSSQPDPDLDDVDDDMTGLGGAEGAGSALGGSGSSHSDAPLQLPTTLDRWALHHATAAVELLIDMETDWRSRLVTELHDALHDSYNLYMRETEEYDSSPIKQMLCRARVMMARQLSELAEASVDDLVRFVASSSAHPLLAEEAAFRHPGMEPTLAEVLASTDQHTGGMLHAVERWTLGADVDMAMLASAAGFTWRLPAIPTSVASNARFSPRSQAAQADDEGTKLVSLHQAGASHQQQQLQQQASKAQTLSKPSAAGGLLSPAASSLWHSAGKTVSVKESEIGLRFGHPGQMLALTPGIMEVEVISETTQQAQRGRGRTVSTLGGAAGGAAPHRPTGGIGAADSSGSARPVVSVGRASRKSVIRPDSNTAMASLATVDAADVAGGRDTTSRWVVGPFPSIHGVHGFAQPPEAEGTGRFALEQQRHRPALFKVTLTPCKLEDLDASQLHATLVAATASLAGSPGAGPDALPFPRQVAEAVAPDTGAARSGSSSGGVGSTPKRADSRSGSRASLSGAGSVSGGRTSVAETPRASEQVRTVLREESAEEAVTRAVAAATQWQLGNSGIDLRRCSDGAPRGARIVPSPEDVIDSLTGTLSSIAEAAASVTGIESSVLTLMPFRPGSLLPLSREAREGDEYPIAGSADAADTETVLGDAIARASDLHSRTGLAVPDTPGAALSAAAAAMPRSAASSHVPTAVGAAVGSASGSAAGFGSGQSPYPGSASIASRRQLWSGDPASAGTAGRTAPGRVQQGRGGVPSTPRATRAALPRTVERNPASVVLETRLAGARRTLAAMVEADARQPRALAALYGRYAWVLALHPRALVTGVVIRRVYRPLLDWMVDEHSDIARQWRRIVHGVMPREAEACLLASLNAASKAAVSSGVTVSRGAGTAAANAAASAAAATSAATSAATAAAGMAAGSGVGAGSAMGGSGLKEGMLPVWMTATAAGRQLTADLSAEVLDMIAANCSAFEGTTPVDIVAMLEPTLRVDMDAGWDTEEEEDTTTSMRCWPVPVGSMYKLDEDEDDITGMPRQLIDRARRRRAHGRRVRMRTGATAASSRRRTHRIGGRGGDGSREGGTGDGLGYEGGYDRTATRKRRVWNERALMRAFYRAGQEVTRVSDDTVRMGVFEVDCGAYKSAIATQAKVLLSAVACLVMIDCERVVRALVRRYTTLEADVLQRPRDARGMDNQRKLIDSVDSDIAKLDAIAADTVSRLEALGEFGISVPEAVLRGALKSKLWPKRIAEAANESQTALDLLADEVAQRLDDEKTEFEKVLGTLPDRVMQFYSIGGASLVGDKDMYEKAAEDALALKEALDHAEDRAADINERQQILGQTATEFDRLASLKQDFAPFYKLWSTVVAFESASASWLGLEVRMLNAVEMGTQLNEWEQTCKRLRTQLQRVDPPKAVVEALAGKVAAFKRNVPVVEALASEALSRGAGDKISHEHWHNLAHMFSPDEPDSFLYERSPLQSLLDCGVLERLPEVEDIAYVASKQLQLHKALQLMDEELRATEVDSRQHKSTGTLILHNVDDVSAVLEDQLVRVQTVLLSPYLNSDIESTAQSWKQLLTEAMELFAVWLDVQRAWIYLEPIFGAHDIHKQMREHGHRFREADKQWRRSVATVVATNSVAAIAETNGLLLQLQHAWTKLDSIQRDLSKFLETKRTAFPRFYFLSDDELLEILAETKDPTRVQPHLAKAFDGLVELEFTETQRGRDLREAKEAGEAAAEAAASAASASGLAATRPINSGLDAQFDDPDAEKAEAEAAKALEGTLVITAMMSRQGERVEFDDERMVDPHLGSRRGNVESWMREVERSMQSTLRDATSAALVDHIQSLGMPGDVEWTSRVAAGALGEWLKRWPGQVVLAVNHILWTHTVERTLRRVARSAEVAGDSSAAARGNRMRVGDVSVDVGPLRALADSMEQMVLAVASTLRRETRPDHRATLAAATTLSVHSRDVVAGLARTGVTSPSDFDWARQLRAYWEPGEDAEEAAFWTGDDGASISPLQNLGGTGREGGGKGAGSSKKQAAGAAGAAAAGPGINAARRRRTDGASGGGVALGADPVFVSGQPATTPRLPLRVITAVQYYGWEYVGNAPRLVVTPLTDRAYRTMMTAIHMAYGGSPMGPAGTGKTETVKDLAKAVGVRSVVFNCSEGLDVPAMRKFFTGLAASGSWSCLDEFNRIDIEVLSVVAEQILTLQQAKRSGNARFNLGGPSIPMLPSCNVFVTMNPGYVGRTELPDNLAALFRPVAMMVPDFALIAEVKLYAEGFRDARGLARKVVELHNLCAQVLSKQQHYDYGMRSVNSVIQAAGKLKAQRSSKTDERALVYSAIEDVNAAKFTANDAKLFRGIMGDLFPGVSPAIDTDTELADATEQACAELGMEPTQGFVTKLQQLQTLGNVRHGLMMIGPAGAGKTSVVKTLAAAHTRAAVLQRRRLREADQEVFLAEQRLGASLEAERAKQNDDYEDDEDDEDDDDDRQAGADGEPSAAGDGITSGVLSVPDAEAALTRSMRAADAVRRETPRLAMRLRVLNPKALSISEMYGFPAADTQDWQHGVLALAVTEGASLTTENPAMPDPLAPELLAPTPAPAPASASASVPAAASSSSSSSAGAKAFSHASPAKLNAAGRHGAARAEGASAATSQEAEEDAEQNLPCMHWTVLDGPVDVVWVESLNSVLDDNRKLCLSSGQVVALTERMAMLFEVDRLEHVSPATTSRCGMVYCDSASVSWRMLVDAWLKTGVPEEASAAFASAAAVLHQAEAASQAPRARQRLVTSASSTPGQSGPPGSPGGESGRASVTDLTGQPASAARPSQRWGEDPALDPTRTDQTAKGFLRRVFDWMLVPVLALIERSGGEMQQTLSPAMLVQTVLSLLRSVLLEEFADGPVAGGLLGEEVVALGMHGTGSKAAPARTETGELIGAAGSSGQRSTFGSSRDRPSKPEALASFLAVQARLEALSVFAILWGVGSSASADTRNRMDKLVRRLSTAHDLGELDAVGARSAVRSGAADDDDVAVVGAGAAGSAARDRPLSLSDRLTPPSGDESGMTDTGSPTVDVHDDALFVEGASTEVLHPDVGVRHAALTLPTFGSLFDFCPSMTTSGRTAVRAASNLMGQHAHTVLGMGQTAAGEAAALASAPGGGGAGAGSAMSRGRRAAHVRVAWQPWLRSSSSEASAPREADVVGWTELPELFPLPVGCDVSSVFVPTADSVRLSSVMGLLLSHRHSVMLVGPDGTGKTVVAKKMLAALPASRAAVASLRLTAGSTPADMRRLIEGPMGTRRAGVLGPTMGRRAVVFADDISMPAPDVFGSVPALELLRTVMDARGWHDPAVAAAGRSRTFRTVEDVQFVASANPASAGQHLSQRLARHFAVISCGLPSRQSLRRIFGSIAETFVKSSSQSVTQDLRAVAAGLADASVDLLDALAERIRPSPMRPQYSLSVRELSRVWQGVLRASVDDHHSPTAMARLWGHECLRVFADRLLDKDDTKWALAQMASKLSLHNPSLDWHDILRARAAKSKASTAVEDIEAATRGEALFSDFVATPEAEAAAAISESDAAAAAATSEPGGGKEAEESGRGVRFAPPAVARRYQHVPSAEQLSAALESGLKALNASTTHSKLDIVLFPAMRDHICRVARALGLPGRHVVMVGLPGSGRLSATRLAAHITGTHLVESTTAEGSSLADWHAELHEAVMRAGLREDETALVLGDSALANLAVLLDMGALMSGEPVLGVVQVEDERAIVEAAATRQRAESKRKAALAEAAGAQEAAAAAAAAAAASSSPDGAAASSPAELGDAGATMRAREAEEEARDAAEAAMEAFWERVSKKLHVVIRASVTSDRLRRAMQRIPAIKSGCYVDVVRPWHHTELHAVASKLVAGLRAVPRDLSHGVVMMLSSMHEDAHRLSRDSAAPGKVSDHVSPPLFLSLVHTHSRLLNQLRSKLRMQRTRYERGVECIDETELAVLRIRRELKALLPKLRDADADAEAQMTVIDKQRAAADATQALVEAEAAACTARIGNATMLKERCDEELAKAVPAMEAATAALETIRMADIAEMKAMRRPLEPVKEVLAAVCVLLKEKPVKTTRSEGGRTIKVADYWATAQKKLFSDSRLLSRLKKFKKDKITSAVVEALRPRIENPEFDPAFVSATSVAASNLCTWVKAIVTYYDVRQVVIPMQAAAAEASEASEAANLALQAKEGELAAVQSRLQGLVDDFEAFESQRSALRQQYEDSEAKELRAGRLLRSLDGERSLWREKCVSLEHRMETLVGDTLLSAGMVVYLGPYTSRVRDATMKQWRKRVDAMKIPRTVDKPGASEGSESAGETPFRIEDVLSSREQVQVWRANGLPADRLSVENAVCMQATSAWPMLVDPQGQAVAWLKKQWSPDAVQMALETSSAAGDSLGDAGADDASSPSSSSSSSSPAGTAGRRPSIKPAAAGAAGSSKVVAELRRGASTSDGLGSGSSGQGSSAATGAARQAAAFADGRSVVFLRETDSRLQQSVEQAVRLGHVLVMEGCNRGVPSLLDHIVARRVEHAAGVDSVRVGDRAVTLHPRFQLILVTSEAHPDFGPELRAAVCALNFSVTFDGLREQMLSVVTHHESQDLEGQLSEALKTMAASAAMVTAQEDRILRMLSSAPSADELLADQHVSAELEQAHDTAKEAAADARRAEEARISHEARRRDYRPVALRGACLYFAVAQLHSLSSMYAFSLGWVKQQFQLAISGKANLVARRASLAGLAAQPQAAASRGAGLGPQKLQAHVDNATMHIFKAVSRALLQEHRLALALSMTLTIMRAEGRISSAETEVLLSGSVDPTQARERPNPTIGDVDSDSDNEEDEEDEDDEEDDSGDDSVAAASEPDALNVHKSSSSAEHQHQQASGGGKAGWLSERAWADLLAIDAIPGMVGIAEFVSSHKRVFRAVLRAQDPIGELASVMAAAGDEQDTIGALPGARPSAVLPAGTLRSAPSAGSMTGRSIASGGRVPSQASLAAPASTAVGSVLPRTGSSAAMSVAAGGGMRGGGGGGASVVGSVAVGSGAPNGGFGGPRGTSVGDTSTSFGEGGQGRLGGLQQPLGPASAIRRTGRMRQEEAVREQGRRAVGGPLALLGPDVGNRRWKLMTQMQQFMLLRCLRPDAVAGAAVDFAASNLGQFVRSPPATSLEDVYVTSVWSTPIMLSLSKGSDPMEELLALAEAKGKAKDIKVISMGRGQERVAEMRIDEARVSGAWVVLQNCHLVPSWLPTLETIVRSFTQGSALEGFRMWLTAAPTDAFPVAVLERSIKVTTEPASGIQQSMTSALTALRSDWLDEALQPTVTARLAYGLCFFHAACSQRSRYGSLGWAKPYHFAKADLAISLAQMRLLVDAAAPASAVRKMEARKLRMAGKRVRQELLDPDDVDAESATVPFETLEYLIGECNYGGRVTVEADRSLLLAMLRRSVGPRVLPSPPPVADPRLVAAAPDPSIAPLGTAPPLDESGSYTFPLDACGLAFDPTLPDTAESVDGGAGSSSTPAGAGAAGAVVGIASASPVGRGRAGSAASAASSGAGRAAGANPPAGGQSAGGAGGAATKQAEAWRPDVSFLLQHAMHNLPSTDVPGAVGLHANALGAASRGESQATLRISQAIQPTAIGTSKSDLEWSAAGALGAGGAGGGRSGQGSGATGRAGSGAGGDKPTARASAGSGGAAGGEVSQQALLERLAEADAQADASVDNEAKAPSGALVGRASAVCAAMLEVLAAPIDADAAQKRFPSRLDRTLNTVLLHEVEAANGAIEALGAHLSRVAAALQGDLPLTQQLEEDAGALAAGRVPDAWRTAGGGVGRAIQSASAFLRAINARVGEVRAWASREDGTSPASVPLGALWHPQAFLTAVKQSFARRTGTAVDDVELKARVMSVVSPGADLEPPPDPPGGVYVHGLTVLGAEWDRENGELKDPAGTTLTSTIPMVWLRPVMVASSRPDDGSAAGPESVDDSVDAGEDASSVPVPVFVSSEREEQVTTFSMPSTPSLDREQWKLRGVCILCESLEQ